MTSNYFINPRDLIYITGIAIIIFIITTFLSNYFLKSGPEIIHFGYPFCFYYEYVGYMAQQNGSNMKYFAFDVIIAWGFTFVLCIGAKLAWRLIATRPK